MSECQVQDLYNSYWFCDVHSFINLLAFPTSSQCPFVSSPTIDLSLPKPLNLEDHVMTPPLLYRPRF